MSCGEMVKRRIKVATQISINDRIKCNVKKGVLSSKKAFLMSVKLRINNNCLSYYCNGGCDQKYFFLICSLIKMKVYSVSELKTEEIDLF